MYLTFDRSRWAFRRPMKTESVVAVFAGIFVATTSIVLLRAQETVLRPKFEVASIKPNKSEVPVRGPRSRPGRFVEPWTTLKGLIRTAYCPVFRPCEMFGGPAWLASDRFDVEATGDFTLADNLTQADGSLGRVSMMVQSLLAERFKLALHTETRELPVYFLTTINRDGKFGPRLRRSETDCAAVLATFAKNGEYPSAATPGQTAPCTAAFGPGKLIIEDLSMPKLAGVLSGLVDRIVSDHTGLNGNFDLTLEWAPNEAAADSSRVSIFTALQEQLGLKLNPQRGPVDVLVIDHAELPTPD